MRVGESAYMKVDGVYHLNGERVLDPSLLEPHSSIAIANNSRVTMNFEMRLGCVMVLDECHLHARLRCDEFQARNAFNYVGHLFSHVASFGHGLRFEGSMIVEEGLEIGNNAVINGNIDCKELRLGENAKIRGYIRADKVYAGSGFSSDSEVTCNLFHTGQNVSLMGVNKIGIFFSKDRITMNGGTFNELHTDDNFRSACGISGNKLIMDNCANIAGSVRATEYVRVGDMSAIEGDVECGDYFEYGPGTKVKGKKSVKREKQLPPSSAKVRKNGKVTFPPY